MSDVKLFIDTLGCPKNFNDSQCASGIWEASGNTVVTDATQADVIMINTCGFIGDAKKESIDHIFSYIRIGEEMEALGVKKPLICVSGCLSQRYACELAEEMPEVDLFLGVNEYETMPDIIAKALGRKESRDLNRVYTGCSPETFDEFSARKLDDHPYTATIRVSEGCNNRCAYCVIPSIRGNYRSRTMENVISEAERLAEAGCKELILIAQDVTEYGRDLYGKLCLPELLDKLCLVEGIRWIRLMYCYEDKITDELIRTIASQDKICNYIDIPLQHVSDKVLKNMRRRSTSAGIKDTLSRLRTAVPDIHIRTTFITGFPGETREDFDELLDFVMETRIERLGVFPYSREEGTLADAMPGHLEEEEKQARADEIMRHQVEISRDINNSKVGMEMEVMIDGPDEEDMVYLGRTRYDAPEIDNTVIVRSSEKLEPGDIIKAKIIDAFDYDLVADYLYKET